MAPCVAREPHFGGPAPAAKHTYIDAFHGKTVTRETLLRYTFKSRYVNVLISGNVWKTARPASRAIHLSMEFRADFEARNPEAQEHPGLFP